MLARGMVMIGLHITAAVARPVSVRAGLPLIDGKPVRSIGQVNVPAARFFPDGKVDPEAYIVSLIGACMEPEIFEGARAVVSPALPLRCGQFVILWPAGGTNPLVKRLVISPPDWPGLGLPASQVRGCLVFETLNPPRMYCIDADSMAAIHAIAGIITPAEYRDMRR